MAGGKWQVSEQRVGEWAGERFYLSSSSLHHLMIQCGYCGQMAQDTDTVCWQCGRPLLLSGTWPKAAAETAESMTAERPFSLIVLAAYGGMTLFIIIALFVVTNALGRQPQVVQGVRTAIKPGWTAVTDHSRTFTLNLPSQWRWLDRFDGEQEAAFIEQMRQNNRYSAALAPYDELADDRQVLLLAAPSLDDGDATMSPFIIIARSPQLSQQSPEQMIAFLRRSPAGITLLRSNVTEGINGRQQTLVIITLPYDGRDLRCQQLFFKDEPDSFMIAGCAAENDYSDLTNIFHDILVSFQPLLP